MATNVASLWLSAGSLQRRQKTGTAWWKQYSQAVRYTMGSSFLSFCQQMLDKSWTLAQPCGIISPLCVMLAFTSSRYSLFSVQTETLLLAHTCGFHAEVEIFLQIKVLRLKRWGLLSKITATDSCICQCIFTFVKIVFNSILSSSEIYYFEHPKWQKTNNVIGVFSQQLT